MQQIHEPISSFTSLVLSHMPASAPSDPYTAMVLAVCEFGMYDLACQWHGRTTQETLCLFRESLARNLGGDPESLEDMVNRVILASSTEFGRELMIKGGESLQAWVMEQDRDAPMALWLFIEQSARVAQLRGGGLAAKQRPPVSAGDLKAVHDILAEYLKIHEVIFGSEGGLLAKMRSAFKPIDFRGAVVVLAGLSSQLAELQKHMSPDGWVDGSAGATVHGYCSALYNAIQILRNMSEGLAAKSERQASYSMEQYQQDLKCYQAAVARYRLMGEQVNRLLHSSL
jgi:hypothetical protein